MTFETHIDYLAPLKLHYVFIPSEVLTLLNNGEERGKFKRRVHITLSDRISWQGGVVALGEGNGYVTVSAARMKKLELERHQTILVKLEHDDSEFGHEMPLELKELFNQDQVARDRFFSLAPGKQRTILYYINQVKAPDKRAERCWFYMKNLCSLPIGKESMRGIFGKE